MQHEYRCDYTNDIRYKGGKNHAVPNFDHRRCYFVYSHGNERLNLWDHIWFCSHRDAVLTYPRSAEELDFIWRFYHKFRGWDGETNVTIWDDWFLHFGLIKPNSNASDNLMFQSVDVSFDSSLNYNNYNGLNLFYFASTVYVPEWETYVDLTHYPSVCVTSDHHRASLLGCLPRMRTNHSICHIDF